VVGPGRYAVELSWDNPELPFHFARRPEEGLVLQTRNGCGSRDVTFRAMLHAVTSDGRRVQQEVCVPVRFVPQRQ
jgi:hypothetical protein